MFTTSGESDLFTGLHSLGCIFFFSRTRTTSLSKAHHTVNIQYIHLNSTELNLKLHSKSSSLGPLFLYIYKKC